MKVVCITNDIEATTITGEVYNREIAVGVQNYALPRVLAIYKKYNVRATFYCLASYVRDYPDVIRQIQAAGHEVACHGLVHDSDKAFDMLSYEQQVAHLSESKHMIEAISGPNTVISFRAPALRVNEDTCKALANTGFKTDSSIAPQRLDAFMSLGSKKKLQWIGAPREIYQASDNNLARRGYSCIRSTCVCIWIAIYQHTNAHKFITDSYYSMVIAIGNE